MTNGDSEHGGSEELAYRVVELLNGRTIAAAESCTAGRITQALATVEKASEFLRGGVTSYQERVKRSLLGVTASSVFTKECAEQMATGAARLFDAAVAVSTTGLAGGDSLDGTPPGTVYIAVFIDGEVSAAEYHFSGAPTEVCDQACRRALADAAAAMRLRNASLGV